MKILKVIRSIEIEKSMKIYYSLSKYESNYLTYDYFYFHHELAHDGNLSFPNLDELFVEMSIIVQI